MLGSRRAVSVLKDSGRQTVLHVLPPHLDAALPEARRAGVDDARLAGVLREAEADARIARHAGTTHNPSVASTSLAREPAAGR